MDSFLFLVFTQLTTSCCTWRSPLWKRALNWRWRWRSTAKGRGRGSDCRYLSCFFSSIGAPPSHQTSASTDAKVCICGSRSLWIETFAAIVGSAHTKAICSWCSLQAERHHSAPQGALASRDPVRDPLHRAEKHRISLLQAVQRPRRVRVSVRVPLPQVGQHHPAHDGLRVATEGWGSTCLCCRGEEPLCVNNFNVRRGSPWSHDFVQVCDFWGGGSENPSPASVISWYCTNDKKKLIHTSRFFLLRGKKWFSASVFSASDE